MKRSLSLLGTMTAVFFGMLAPAGAAPQIGKPAPAFSGVGSDGKTYALADFKGKYVVLEWHNQGCPYTKKHYESGNMQRLQKEWTAKGVVWLTVISSAPGMQGFVTPSQENDYLKTMNAAPTAVLMDPTGVVARLYAAKTTPHMYVIDKDGSLKYMGGIDSLATTDEADIARAEPYLKEAMLAVALGNPPPHAVTKPYGCSIKY